MKQVSVAQVGARMHYAVPRILSAHGYLGRLFTDIATPKGISGLFGRVPKSLLPAALRRLLGRIPGDIPTNRIRVFPRFGIEYYLRRRMVQDSSSLTGVHLWAAKRFNKLVVESKEIQGDSIYVYNSAGLEILQYAKVNGMRAFYEQTIAPRKIEEILIAKERDSFGEWEDKRPDDSFVSEFIDRERSEWGMADLIVCGSEFVKNAIAQAGGPIGHCVVVPYGVHLPKLDRRSRGIGPRLRVLTVGTVELRKGSPYVVGAAERLRKWVDFRVVGSFAASPRVLREFRNTIDYRGAVPRSEMAEHFKWADVFLLPSICEGSATVTYEALSYGLPVICTTNAGSVVTDGVNGFLIPTRSTEEIVSTIEKLLTNHALLEAMADGAYLTREYVSIQSYERRLLKALELS